MRLKAHRELRGDVSAILVCQDLCFVPGLLSLEPLHHTDLMGGTSMPALLISETFEILKSGA